MTASGCSSRPAPPAISHPPADDLRCQDEPTAPLSPAGELSAEQVAAFERDALDFDGAALLAGRSCRDALARVCRWHRARGMAVTCP
ncbi:MAG: hypothetical protein CMN63_00145 [Sphingobium sp.]|nr:hypothetical protein [Sphingobium sp.]